MKKTLGERLRVKRGSRSQAEIARVFGVSQSAYSAWERDIKEPSLNTVSSICAHYGVSADWLLGLSPGAASPAPIPASSPAAPPAAPSASTLLALIASQQETIRDQAASLRILAAPKKTCAAPAGGATATKPA